MVSIHFLPPAPGVTAGLALMQRSAFQVRLKVRADRDRWIALPIQRSKGVDRCLGTELVDAPALDTTGRATEIEVTAELYGMELKLLAVAAPG